MKENHHALITEYNEEIRDGVKELLQCFKLEPLKVELKETGK